LHSPQSTYFYGIHGLVDSWWRHLPHPKQVVKDVLDTKHHLKELIKETFKELTKEHLSDKHFKEKDKDIFEGDFGRPGDPGPLLGGITRRLDALETAVHGRAFIQPAERPDVAAPVVDADHGKNR
jgi:hypothetical protein